MSVGGRASGQASLCSVSAAEEVLALLTAVFRRPIPFKNLSGCSTNHRTAPRWKSKESECDGAPHSLLPAKEGAGRERPFHPSCNSRERGFRLGFQVQPEKAPLPGFQRLLVATGLGLLQKTEAIRE